MRPTIFGLLACTISIADAFRDTSPFFFFSASEILISSPQIVPAASLSKAIASELQKCPSETYVIVSQPGVNAADYHDRFSAPHLRQNIEGENKSVRSSLTVAEVLGNLDAASMSKVVQEKCGARVLRVDGSTGSFKINEDVKPLVINLDFPALPTEKGRASKLVEHDFFLASVLDHLASSKYTVIYTTTPISAEHYSILSEAENYHIETDFHTPMHVDLKRDFTDHKRASNGTDAPRRAPLFEKYQFFGPGLFMGLFISILLLSILYVGISGISSLEVSYAAFDREMGPSTQQKQSQL